MSEEVVSRDECFPVPLYYGCESAAPAITDTGPLHSNCTTAASTQSNRNASVSEMLP